MGIRRRERVRDVIRISAHCVFWSVFWYFHVHDLWAALIGGVIQGLILGTFVVIMNRHQYRKAFVVAGQRASDDERAAAVAALRSGQLPVEPRQREAAVSFARYQLGRATNPWPVGVIFGLATLGSVFLAIVYSPWSWLAGLCIVLTPAVIVSLRRQRQRARALLMTPFLEPIE